MNITLHDDRPAEYGIVDRGLAKSNEEAAPLHEVRPICCFARGDVGEVLGGAVGRRWGRAAELQELWVEPALRRRGIGAQLVRAFEAHARSKGCDTFYLETFSFQAPSLYRSLGYEVAHAHDVFPHGIVKYLMTKRDPKP